MKKMIKKYLGIVGFLLAMIGMIITAIYKWNETDIEPLGEISFLFWITTWNISSEINKQKPKMWWVYTVSIISLAVICALIFVDIYKS
jgi:magnesium-transporting ATPase (P-type)